MKHLIFFVFWGVFLVNLNGFAQIPKLDSLQKILKKTSRDDTNKVLLLSELSETYFQNYYVTSGLLYNQRLLQLARKLRYKKGEGLFLQNMAFFQHNNRMAFSDNWQAAQIFKDLQDEQTMRKMADFFSVLRLTSSPDGIGILDSLKSALAFFTARKDKAIQAEIFQYLTIYALNKNQREEALNYGQKAFNLYQESQNIQGSVSALLNLITISEKQEKQAKSFEKELFIILGNIKDKRMLGLGLYLTGWSYRDQNRYALAIEYYLKCTQEVASFDKALMGYAMFRIGQLYRDQEYHKKASEYFYRAKDIGEKIKNDWRINMIEIYNSLGYSLTSEHKLEEALQYHLQAKTIAEVNKDKFGLGRSMDGIGNIYMEKGKYQEALPYFFQSAADFDEVGNLIGSSYIYLYIAQCYRKLANLKECLHYAQKAYQIAQEVNWGITKIKTSLLLAEVYEELGEYKQAYQYQKIYNAVKDSVFGWDNTNRLANIAVRSAIEKSQQEIELLEKDKQIQAQINYNQRLWLALSIGTGLTLLLVVSILYLNNQAKQKSNRQLAEQKEEIQMQADNLFQANATKDKLFAIIGHDLRTPLNSLKGVMNLLDDREISPQEFLMFSNKLKNNVENVHATLNNLLLWANSQLRGLQTNPQQFDLQLLTADNFRLLDEVAKTKNICLINNVPQPTQVWADIDHISLVLRNLISNALKFTPKEGIIELSAQLEEMIWKISVKDTGIGISEENLSKLFDKAIHFTTKGTNNEKGTGLGLLLCQEMIEKNGGKIWVESKVNEGSNFIFTLPKFESKINGN